MEKFFSLDFFDGETNPEAAASQPANDAAAQQPQQNVQEPQQEVEFSEFDVPSPLLRTRTVDEAEESTPHDNPAPQGGTGAEEQQSQPQPYKTLKYHGQDVPIANEEELMRLASQGLDYTQKTQRLASYRGLIERLEADPFMMSQVAALIQGRPVSRPQPQTHEVSNQQAQPQQEKPEWQENESYEEYAARLEEWNKSRQNAPQQSGRQQQTPQDMMAMVNQALDMRQRADVANALARATVADPRHVDVLREVQNLPAALQMAMNTDPGVYQMVYDQLRINMIGESYFAGLHRNVGATQPPQQAQPQQTGQAQPAARQQQQTVQLKGGTKPAPYVEPSRGQNAPVGTANRDGLPDDIWAMSDKDFDKLVESVPFRR